MGVTKDIVEKAMKDAAFRERLLKDAKGTLKKDFGVELPASVNVKVHENSPTVFNLVLPGQLDLQSQRALSEDELQNVAGGFAVPTLDPGVAPLPGVGLPIPGQLSPRLGGKIAKGGTFGAYTGCCSSTGRIL